MPGPVGLEVGGRERRRWFGSAADDKDINITTAINDFINQRSARYIQPGWAQRLAHDNFGDVMAVSIVNDRFGYVASGLDHRFATQLFGQAQCACHPVPVGFLQLGVGRSFYVKSIPFGIERFGQAAGCPDQALAERIRANPDQQPVAGRPRAKNGPRPHIGPHLLVHASGSPAQRHFAQRRQIAGPEKLLNGPGGLIGHAAFNLRLDPLLDSIAWILHYPHVVQLHPGQKAEAINILLRRHRTLVVADNLETVTDPALIKFLEQLPEPSAALATTRYLQLRRAWNIILYGLKEHETIRLTRQHSQRLGLSELAGADEALLQRLAIAVGHNPKAVKLALGLIKQKGLPFNTQVDNLFQASQVVREMIDYLLAEAWKLLDNDTRQVLLVMSLFVSSASQAALASVAKVEQIDQAIEQLAGMSLLETGTTQEESQPHYSLHPLIQKFARYKLGVDKHS